MRSRGYRTFSRTISDEPPETSSYTSSTCINVSQNTNIACSPTQHPPPVIVSAVHQFYARGSTDEGDCRAAVSSSPEPPPSREYHETIREVGASNAAEVEVVGDQTELGKDERQKRLGKQTWAVIYDGYTRILHNIILILNCMI